MQMYNNSLKYIDHITIIYDDDDGDRNKFPVPHMSMNKQTNKKICWCSFID